MLRIGAFSKLSKVTIKALHHYDEIGLLKPHYINAENGYRYYKPYQLNTIFKIISLKSMGCSLEEIDSLISEDVSKETLYNTINNKRTETINNISAENEKLSRITAFLKSLKEKTIMEVKIKQLPEVIVASMRQIIPEYAALHQVAPAMGKIMKQHGAICAEPAYCFNIYHDDEYKDKNIDVEICESVVSKLESKDDLTYKIMPSVSKAACLLHKGPYEKLVESYAQAFEWIDENNYSICNNLRESFIDGCWNKDDPNEWLTEIQIPVTKN